LEDAKHEFRKAHFVSVLVERDNANEIALNFLDIVIFFKD